MSNVIPLRVWKVFFTEYLNNELWQRLDVLILVFRWLLWSVWKTAKSFITVWCTWKAIARAVASRDYTPHIVHLKTGSTSLLRSGNVTSGASDFNGKNAKYPGGRSSCTRWPETCMFMLISYIKCMTGSYAYRIKRLSAKYLFLVSRLGVEGRKERDIKKGSVGMGLNMYDNTMTDGRLSRHKLFVVRENHPECGRII